MRAAVGFFWLLTLGLVLAAILAMAAPGFTHLSGHPRTGASLDYMSVAAGLGIGLMLALLTHISWSRLPARALQGVLGYARRWSLVGWAVAFAAVLIYL
jgi:hypothetical protein